MTWSIWLCGIWATVLAERSRLLIPLFSCSSIRPAPTRRACNRIPALDGLNGIIVTDHI